MKIKTGLLILSCWTSTSMAAPIEKNLISKISLDTSAKVSLVDNQHSKVVKQNLIQSITNKLDHGKTITLFNQKKSWQNLTGETEGTHLIRFSISAERFIKGKLKVNGAKKASLYLNSALINGSQEFELSLLNQDYRVLMIVSEVESWEAFSIDWTASYAGTKTEENGDTQTAVKFGDDKRSKRASMKKYFDSETVGMLNISPDGELLIWSKSQYSDLTGDSAKSIVEIIDLDSSEVVYRWQAMRPSQITWRQDSQALLFTHGNNIYQLNRKNWKLTSLAAGVKNIRNIEWLNDSELLVSWFKSEKKPHKFTKRYRGLEDRWSYWRGDLQLHLFDIDSGLFKQITNEKLPSAVADIDRENRKILLTRSPIDYKKPAHGLTQLFELDLSNNKETLIGEYRTFSSAQYHNEGIVIGAGPDFKDGVGNNVSNKTSANNYDGQIYLLNNKGKIQPLSKDFSPAIGQVIILKNGDLVVSTTDKDRRQLYRYDFSRKQYTKLDTRVEVVSGFSVSNERTSTIVYKGTSATKPQSVHTRTVRTPKGKTLFDSAKQAYSNVDFIELKDWDYQTQAGQSIDGRVYYPANFDKTKKYPAIIYYYGGTSPVSRSFTGRWPFSLWASQGYVVYVLQPSGATGYGQDFSARHVNAWGINTADEIIESTKAFVKAHPFVDEKRLGNMGASYGGFMTMYLATKTDLFSASISHAGISNLASYWGHGWWGYGYSGVATKGSFPWNKTDFYTEQSPLYSADKVTTPLLLIHGDADTNVPVGESHQMYTALKLLDKDVELVEFQGDDHHINSRERRLRWWKTILSYFDMKLKDQPEWWQSLYPEK